MARAEVSGDWPQLQLASCLQCQRVGDGAIQERRALRGDLLPHTVGPPLKQLSLRIVPELGATVRHLKWNGEAAPRIVEVIDERRHRLRRSDRTELRERSFIVRVYEEEIRIGTEFPARDGEREPLGLRRSSGE